MRKRAMARVRFNADFDYVPAGSAPGTRIRYKAGCVYPGVKREAADLAVAQGAAVEEERPRRARVRT